ncbi:4a-hydroxytetrahydrobiopterin dehydratase [Halobacteriovorax sp. GFR7]|uniref:4a-hydroxytetrahydrobiopterin dehydratase n=1 Tax=unclassified Halobacteriovorax TaxID=2639665 RepID=UPI003D9522F6
MTSLNEKTCIPCQGGVPPLPMDEKLQLKEQLDPRWSFSNDKKRLSLELACDKFNQPMAIANEIAKIADEQWHHPDLFISFGKLKVDLWTHKIDDLVESDFIFASKIDQILKSHKL